MQSVSRFFVLDVFNENNKRVLMSKRKFPEKTKMVSLKSPPKGITMFLQVCMVQIKKNNWEAVKVQLNFIIDHDMLSLCY